MLWFIFSILAAYFESMKDVFSKKGLKNIDEYIVAWSFSLFGLPLLIPLLFFIEIPFLGPEFWRTLFIVSLLDLVAIIIYMKAIKHSDLSVTVPMIAFTPLFLLITSPIMLGEFPDIFGLLGIILIVLGSYVLNIKEKKKGYLVPFKALIKDNGPRLMLIVAFIWAITSNYHKIGILNSSVLFWVISKQIAIVILMLPIILSRSRKNIGKIKTNVKALAPIGLFSALTLIFQMTAISMTLVAYVISIKRTSTVMTVLFGYLIFKEKGVKERILGSIIMILGVVLISLS